MDSPIVTIPKISPSDRTSESSEGKESILRPFTAVKNSRYDRLAIVAATYVQIPHDIYSAFCTQRPNIPSEWTSHLQPEGDVYYVNSTLHIITDTPLHVSDFYQRLCQVIEQLMTLIATSDMKLPDHYEIFLQLNAATGKCDYYLVDHGAQIEFWLQNNYSYDLGLPQVSSISQLRHLLQEHYWTHMEYYPHRLVPENSRKELLNVLRHARGDHMTSDTSTFPFNAEQCDQFISLLDIGPEESQNPYMTCVIARIWAAVSRSRFDHFHGEHCARLGRDQRRIESPKQGRTILMKLCSGILFGLPRTKTAELNSLLTDNIVYVIHWRKFAKSLFQDWKDSSIMSLGILIANIGCLGLGKTFISIYSGLGSTILSMGGILSSLTLQQRYFGIDDHTATFAAEHLYKIEHGRLGFEPVAALYSLPKALLMWSIIFLISEIFTIAVELAGQEVGIIAASMILLFGTIILARYLIIRASSLWWEYLPARFNNTGSGGVLSSPYV